LLAFGVLMGVALLCFDSAPRHVELLDEAGREYISVVPRGRMTRLQESTARQQVLFPEIPDEFPDPDPYPYGGKVNFPDLNPFPPEKGTEMARGFRRSQLSLRQDRNGETADMSLGGRHGCEPEQIVLFPGDDECDPLRTKMAPVIQEHQRWLDSADERTKGGVHWTTGDTGDPRMELMDPSFRDRDIAVEKLKSTWFRPAIGVGPSYYTNTVGTRDPRRAVLTDSGHLPVAERAMSPLEREINAARARYRELHWGDRARAQGVRVVPAVGTAPDEDAPMRGLEEQYEGRAAAADSF